MRVNSFGLDCEDRCEAGIPESPRCPHLPPHHSNDPRRHLTRRIALMPPTVFPIFVPH